MSVDGSLRSTEAVCVRGSVILHEVGGSARLRELGASCQLLFDLFAINMLVHGSKQTAMVVSGLLTYGCGRTQSVIGLIQ